MFSFYRNGCSRWVGIRTILISAAIVVLIAGLKSASSILSPLFMAVFISIIFSPCIFWLKNKGLSTTFSLIIIFGLICLFSITIFNIIANSLNEVSAQLPQYQQKLSTVYAKGTLWLESFGLTFFNDILSTSLDPTTILKIVNYLLNGLSGLLGNSLVVLLAVMFMLGEVAGLPAKLCAALPNPDTSMANLKRFSNQVIHYLALKAATSALTGACVALVLWIFNIDYIFLWALLAFLLNFIPYVGSILAGLPAVLLALIDHGLWVSIWVSLGYLSINLIIGNIIETRLMGDSLNLSSVVVFISLIFWGWLLGPTGLFLSTPLTILIIIGLQSSESTKQYATLLTN